ncbi:MAG: UdgX family uracil-DNA binding protein [Actinomycetota bacterium]|nr:UdgX family uracil-DNA binding protein [Actinomycetota bacterium]
MDDRSPSRNPAPELLEEGASLEEIRRVAMGCQACDLYRNATQTVFGEGPESAQVVLIGEQPGDDEDQEGEPFVGAAGRRLDRALEEAGIDRGAVYVTNVVKHFKWKPKGKRRIHKKPNAEEIRACSPWLEAELELVKPKVVVCLGATAAQALLGRSFKVSRQRGEFVEWDREPLVMATVHPSSILRAPNDATRHENMRRFVKDLEKVAEQLEE